MGRSTKDYGNQSGVKEVVEKEFERQPYDLKSLSLICGHIGGLQTIKCVPVIAGDSMELSLDVIVRLSPLTRPLLVDAQVDLFAFYVPHRHVYTNWIQFLKEGYDESVTLGSQTMGAGVFLDCCGLRAASSTATYPSWIPVGYIRIFNRYFKDPMAADLADDYFTTITNTDKRMHAGLQVCHLKALETTTMPQNLTTADYRLALDGGEVNLYQLAEQKARLQTETSREWYGLRYSDLLRHTWNSSATTDQDQRPELVCRESFFLSGYDVDGTDDATLGSFSGKAVQLGNLSFPMKFFPEHGALWLMMTVRFPFVNVWSTHYLATKSEPTYKQISGDPLLGMNLPPIDLLASDTYSTAGATNLGQIPYYQWYRTEPNRVMEEYLSSGGHPFISDHPSNRADAIYVDYTDYDNSFKSNPLRHWAAQAHVGLFALRCIPDPQKSIFAGSK